MPNTNNAITNAAVALILLGGGLGCGDQIRDAGSRPGGSTTVNQDPEANRKAGEAFLAENATKEGVQTTASGLQYLVLEEGDGPSPAATDVVRVHYHGTLIDGTVFDSSVDRGKPAEFPLNGVITGWTEGLQLMKVGGKTKFFIPSELAYGANPRPGGPIGPNEALVFEVELLEVVGKE